MLNPLLFFMILEALALSKEMRLGYTEEFLYVDDLALVSESFEGLKGMLEAWRGGLGPRD